MAFDFLTSQTFEVETCCSCGVQFAMTSEFQAERLKNRGANNPFYCPNGHKQHYTGKSEADKLREQNAQLQTRIEMRDKWLREERERKESAERRASAARGQVTKIRKRVGHGVCPCCNRSFEDLRRHMSIKHPAYHEAAE
jgi:hypothetical protein